jgi:putative RecB family exonuclease
MAEDLKLTPSGLEDFEWCPLHFSLKHLRKLPPSAPRRAPHLAFGNSVHDCLYLFYKGGAHQVYDREAMVALLRRGWTDREYASDEEQAGYWQEAVRICQEYHSASRDEPTAHLGSEVFLQAPLRVDGASVLLSGKLDRLAAWPDGHLRVIDYKTGSEAEPGPAKLAAKLSTFLYYLLAFVNYPQHRPVEVCYIYLRTLRQVAATYDADLGAECKARLKRAVSGILAGDFPATPSQRCAWCEYPDLCTRPRPGEMDLDEIM